MSARNALARPFFALLLLPFCASSFAEGTPASAEEPLLRLSTTSPGAGRGGSVIQDAQWALNFKLRSKTAPGFVEIRERLSGRQDFDVLVLSDPDNCLDLTNVDPMITEPFEAGCPGGADETVIRFRQDPFEVPGLIDSTLGGATGGCGFDISSRLADSPAGALPVDQTSKSYAPRPSGSFRAVGPRTGGFSDDAGDCYGYGADDDLYGLVVMADIGGAQIFGTDLVYVTTRIRNMAGLLSRVGYELLDKRGRAAITADLVVTDGMLEPVIFVDLGPFLISGAGSGGYVDPSFSYRIANGPVQTVALQGTFSDAALLDEVRAATTLPYTIDIRSVVVEGDAPDFIDDLDGNGVFDRRDLTAAGYTLLSNQSRLRLDVQPREFLRVEQDAFECPRNLVYTDLDGDGLAFGCDDGDGTSRSFMRVPR